MRRDYYHNNYSCWRPRPIQSDFDLEIVSKHPEFNGRSMKKYSVEGIDTIGCWGDEPFEVHFHNRSSEDVQVRISLDGTDILTAKPASLEINHDMWFVRAGRTLHLRAWAETNKGGAKFVFTSGDKSVALHAHGDVSHKGVISAAVFTERDRPQHVLQRRFATTKSASRFEDDDAFKGGDAFGGSGILGGGFSGGPPGSGRLPGVYSNVVSSNVAAPVPASGVGSHTPDAVLESFGNRNRETVVQDYSLSEQTKSKSLKKEAAVGAGEFVEQRTHTVKGLDNPVLNSILRVRYMWWDDLLAKLSKHSYDDPHPTGFPAEKIKSFADLSNVPRVSSVADNHCVCMMTPCPHTKTATQTYDRF